MDKSLGKKIFSAAQVISIIGYSLSGIGSFVLLCIGLSKLDTSSEDFGIAMILLGIAVLIVGCLISWLSALLLKGFGSLVYNSSVLVEYTKADNKNIYKIATYILSDGNEE